MRRLILPLALFAFPTVSAQTHIITHNYTLGGEGGWDYVVPDAPNHRLFIGRSNRVMVVDMNDGHLIGEVTGINGAHGTAIAPGTRRGFATSGNDSSIVMFDTGTYKVLGRIPAAEDAAGAVSWRSPITGVAASWQRCRSAAVSTAPATIRRRGSRTHLTPMER